MLLRPILFADYDFVAPYYQRHKYDGTITNSIVYPLTRSLYGVRVRQPIGGEFGISAKLIARYLERDDWETDVARYGIDIWMTTVAIAEGFRVCQSFLGAKLHDAKDPSSDLSAMLQQVVGSVFMLMEEYQPVWQNRIGSDRLSYSDFNSMSGSTRSKSNVDRMVQSFCRGCHELGEVWAWRWSRTTRSAETSVWAGGLQGPFHMGDDLWTRVVLDYSCAYRKHPLSRGHLLHS